MMQIFGGIVWLAGMIIVWLIYDWVMEQFRLADMYKKEVLLPERRINNDDR